MTQAQQETRREKSVEVEFAFKRHILEGSAGFPSEPEADLYRIGLLGRMLDRYDALRAQGMSEASCVSRVMNEFRDIPSQMRSAGFAPTEREEARHTRWPLMTEDEVSRYMKESDAYLHRTAMGSALCSACVAPLMVGAAFTELYMADIFSMIGLMGMFGMIGMGVYSCVMAVKPKDQKRVKSGRFSLARSVRRRLEQMREGVEERARKRRGRGIALLVTCVMPIFAGAAFSAFAASDFFPVLGVAGMFGMIGLGVYELVMADGEKKDIKKLLEPKD